MLLVLINSKCGLDLKLNGLELHLEWKKINDQLLNCSTQNHTCILWET